MEWSIEVERELGVIRVVARGMWRTDKALGALEQVWTAQAETGIHRVLWDLRGALLSGVNPGDLMEVSAHQNKRRPDLPRARSALLVTRDFEYGMGRMVEAEMAESPVDFDVFKDRDQAMAWLLGHGV